MVQRHHKAERDAADWEERHVEKRLRDAVANPLKSVGRGKRGDRVSKALSREVTKAIDEAAAATAATAKKKEDKAATRKEKRAAGSAVYRTQQAAKKARWRAAQKDKKDKK